MKSNTSRPFVIAACVLIGSLLTGYMTIKGACAAGHDPKAPWPFPDLLGIFFFWGGAVAGPVVAAFLVKLLSLAFPKFRYRVILATLVLTPVIAFPTGIVLYLRHLQVNAESSKRGAEYSRTQRATQDALQAQLIADPEIVLRERWYGLDREHEQHNYLFLQSLKEQRVSYTPALLAEIYQAAPGNRALVVAHPACDAEFLASHWQDALREAEQGDDGILIAVISNPRTPQGLVKELESSPLVTRKQGPHPLKIALDARLHREELVMTRRCEIQATTETASMKIWASADLARSYEWKGVTENTVLESSKKSGSGDPGVYFHGSASWPEHKHDGTVCGEFREGLKKFQTPEQAMEWILQQSEQYPTVYRNDGLLVSCGKNPERKQITVEVWQIFINGNKPASLPGSDDSKLTFKTPALD
jgi:hypothetical protein